MFAALFASIFEFVLFVAAVIVVYQIFLSDWIAAKRVQWTEVKAKSSSMEKIATVKLVSEDPKEIEQFITNNAQFLSNETVQKLADRIESIHADKVIASDEVLKKRIASLPQVEEEEEEVNSKSKHA